MGVRLKRRRVVTDLAGAERVLMEDAPLPEGWTEGGRRKTAVVGAPVTTSAPAPAGHEPTVPVTTTVATPATSTTPGTGTADNVTVEPPGAVAVVGGSTPAQPVEDPALADLSEEDRAAVARVLEESGADQVRAWALEQELDVEGTDTEVAVRLLGKWHANLAAHAEERAKDEAAAAKSAPNRRRGGGGRK
jgi:hypothetical protein